MAKYKHSVATTEGVIRDYNEGNSLDSIKRAQATIKYDLNDSSETLTVVAGGIGITVDVKAVKEAMGLKK